MYVRHVTQIVFPSVIVSHLIRLVFIHFNEGVVRSCMWPQFQIKGMEEKENKHKDHVMLFAHNIEKIKTDLVKSMNSFLY